MPEIIWTTLKQLLQHKSHKPWPGDRKKVICCIIGVDQQLHQPFHTFCECRAGITILGGNLVLAVPLYTIHLAAYQDKSRKYPAATVHILKQEKNLWRTWGVVWILIKQCWTLSQLQVESGNAVSIHCYLVFQWSCEQLELNFLSMAGRKEVLMPRDGTGNDRISPMTLYGVFLKNKVNKTWDAEPQILTSCLWLWGEVEWVGWVGGEWEKGMVRDLKRESEWERRKQGEGGCFDASAIHRHQWDAGACGGRALLLSVMIVGEAKRRRAATNRSNVQNVWKHCNLKIMWQQCTAPLFLCIMV